MKKKREIDWDYIIKLSITWLALLALLLAMVLSMYSCSVAFIKGHHNVVNDTENVDASGEQLDVLDRSRDKAVQGSINQADSLNTIQPLEIVKDTVKLDSISG